MVTLVLAFHNHQPVGNFGWVIEEAYQKAYLPLMDVLAGYPDIRFAQHYTGILLDWFATEHPEFIERLRNETKAGRVELVSGGYYEPILAMLPERDRQMQVQWLNARIEQEFGTKPVGMWLAERVWEPAFAGTLHDAGIGYTFLDDTHFKGAGLTDDELTGYFITEDQGKQLAVFPIDKRLRYTIPFEPPEVTIEYLLGLDTADGNRVVTFADDGEKFGVWPETYRTVYGEKWLQKFCLLLEKHSDRIQTRTPTDVLAAEPPAGRIYLPTSSYAEMLHWALPGVEGYHEYEAFERRLHREKFPESYNRFVRGGFWRNFLVKYPEVNAMQKKMLRVSERAAHVAQGLLHGDNTCAVDANTADRMVQRAYAALLAAQCNCPYWHGVFGGIYLYHIRSATYKNLIEAEQLLDSIEGLREANITFADYDMDGHEELLYEAPLANLYISPASGGAIRELDDKPIAVNLCNVLGRREEGYHAALAPASTEQNDGADTASEYEGEGRVGATEDVANNEKAKSIHDSIRSKEAGLEKLLVYDTYQRGMLLDHVYGVRPDQITPQQFMNGEVEELGAFHTRAYSVDTGRQGENETVIRLVCESAVKGMGVIHIQKHIYLRDDSSDVSVSYVVESRNGEPLTGTFGVEMAYTLSAGTEPDRYYLIDDKKPSPKKGMLNAPGVSSGSMFALTDEWLGLRVQVELEKQAQILRAPIETVSLSENGVERNYQGSVVVMLWELGGASTFSVSFKQALIDIR